ncbi:MAG: hypothetical protein WC887_03175 [Candidatus Paceibacterota bacterium]|jgi:hypothetical protein
MRILLNEKKRAIQLRKQGQTYGEISKKIKVSKSTLSLWLRDVKVPVEFISRIQQKKLDAVKLGWEARRKERIDRTHRITVSAQQEVKRLMSDPLWLVGVALYWAEGHKEKLWRTGTLVTFTNMDADTIILFRSWCRKFLDVSNDDFVCTLYIHDSRRAQSNEMKKWWAQKLTISPESIAVYYKKSVKKHVRHNDADDYHGVLRVRVRRSIDMNRRIAGWTFELVHSLKNKNKLP